MSKQVTAIATNAESTRIETSWRRLARRLAAARLGVVGAAILLLIILAAVFAPLLAPYGPTKVDVLHFRQAPTLSHPFGTDELGRDILSRVIYGARVSLGVGLVSIALALTIGTAVGLVAGYFGGWIDNAAMRVMDALLAFPALILALAIAAAIGAGLTGATIAIAVVSVPIFARLSRGQVLSVRETDFVMAARALGASHTRIVLQHVLPNIVAPLIVQTSLSIALAILAEASLSFLGLGVQPPTPSWGSMVNAGRQYLADAPWL
ncbi:MAG TPA: ABC transporter permease, partial [Thermomicrobiales bacterium]|nr:ABC transporter permease [Thermomicrobiales bacterium]